LAKIIFVVLAPKEPRYIQKYALSPAFSPTVVIFAHVNEPLISSSLLWRFTRQIKKMDFVKVKFAFGEFFAWLAAGLI